MNITIYHNPRCSKSRQTLQLLKDNNIEPVVIEYLQTPPSEQTLDKILTRLNMTPLELMRKKEAAFKENHLDNPELSRSELISAMITHPILIERPIVTTDHKAAIGRPPENVLEII